MRQAESIEISRRRFAIAGLSTGAALLAPRALFAEDRPSTPSNVNSDDPPAIKPGAHTSFASLKQIDAGLLNVGYA